MKKLIEVVQGTAVLFIAILAFLGIIVIYLLPLIIATATVILIIKLLW